MATKGHIENILKVNGLTIASPEKEIRIVLEGAKCQDVDCTLTALRDNKIDRNQDICAVEIVDTDAHAVLRKDSRLEAESIKRLLGIDVEINYADIEAARVRRKNLSFLQVLGIVGWSVLCAAGVIAVIMWQFGMDPLTLFAGV